MVITGPPCNTTVAGSGGAVVVGAAVVEAGVVATGDAVVVVVGVLDAVVVPLPAGSGAGAAVLGGGDAVVVGAEVVVMPPPAHPATRIDTKAAADRAVPGRMGTSSGRVSHARARLSGIHFDPRLGGMITIEETVTTQRAAADVFAYVADFENVAEWDPGIRSSARVSGDGGLGSRYDVEATFAGRVVPLTYEVTHYEAPQRVTLRASTDRFDSEDEIVVADLDGLTRVTYRAEFTLRGLLGRVEFALRPLFARLGRKAIDGLDRALGG
jgi:hypothetical protein